LSKRRIAVVVIGTTSRPRIKNRVAAVIDAINGVEPSGYELRDKAGKVLDHGKYIVIWRREGGNWMFAVFNERIGPEEMTTQSVTLHRSRRA
jgi:hypothetical protein